MKFIGYRRLVIAVLILLSTSLAQAAPEKTIYSFAAAAPLDSDGMEPYSQPVFDAKGNLFATTLTGGTHNAGIIFELSPSKNAEWVETILYEFTGGTDGGNPFAGLVFDHEGNLYGTASIGGVNGTGVVFELSPTASGWTYKVLYSFGAYPSSGDGFAPNSPIVFDKLNNIYGTTNEGGGAGCFEGCGTVFELSPTGTGEWKEQVIHRFTPNGKDGEVPSGGVTFGTNGNLYGTTPNGGTAGSGVLYQLKYSSTTRSWSESIIHQFVGGKGAGSFPTNVILISDSTGNLYGTTDGGGEHDFGTVFEAAYSSTTGWTTKVLYSFNATYSGDGNSPHAGVTMDKQGNLYGTTSYGGEYNYYGTVFKLSKGDTGEWTETTLHSFTGGADGFYPEAGVTIHDGLLYGTAMLGGNDSGVVFQSSE
jgi:uncharacterized repeat protein (TIGR03803 family)